MKPSIDLSIEDENYLIFFVLSNLLKLYSELTNEFFKGQTQSVIDFGIEISTKLYSELVVPLIIKPNSSFLSKVIWIRSYDEKIFEFFFQVLSTYLPNLRNKISKFNKFGLTMFDDVDTPEQVKVILEKYFIFNIEFPLSFLNDLQEFVLKEDCLKMFHTLHRALDNEKIDLTLTVQDTKTLILKIIEDIGKKGKIFTYDQKFAVDSYGITLVKSQYVGIPLYCYKNMIHGRDNYKLLLIIIILHEIAHLVGFHSYKNKSLNSTLEKFMKEA